jgi:site-specific DNA recombinase
MKVFYGYIRVSTARQGEHGVSLEHQREAIERYANKNSLHLAKWFEEQETAAKRGRPVFGQMLKGLRTGKASGVIIHKIDRSARNLKDWADLGELIDSGIEVHFANESLDLHSRGGRLSADIQAVVAADYIRNLREETIKGFYGRLKQGLYPRPAVIGYQDQGPGLPKLPDPVKAPLIRTAFERYATGNYNLDRIKEEMFTLGLRNKSGSKVSRNGMSRILNNPFYTGLIYVKKTGQSFAGVHQPIVGTALFTRVQDILRGKVNKRTQRFCYLFRQLVKCQLCGYSLIGEEHKGHVYYRCHTKTCSTKTVREETLDQGLVHQLHKLEFSQEEKDYFRAKILQMKQDWTSERVQAMQNLELRGSQLQDRQDRLTDAYLDKLIDKETFEQRKTALLKERCLLKENLKNLTNQGQSVPDRLSQVLELAGNAYLAYKLGLDEEKRQMVKILTSNRTVDRKLPMFVLATPFNEVAKRFECPRGRPSRNIRLVWDALIPKLLESLAAVPLAA